MLVLVRGDPAFTKTEVIGLDILAPRQPKLYGQVVNGLGYSVNPSTNIGKIPHNVKSSDRDIFTFKNASFNISEMTYNARYARTVQK